MRNKIYARRAGGPPGALPGPTILRALRAVRGFCGAPYPDRRPSFVGAWSGLWLVCFPSGKIQPGGVFRLRRAPRKAGPASWREALRRFRAGPTPGSKLEGSAPARPGGTEARVAPARPGGTEANLAPTFRSGFRTSIIEFIPPRKGPKDPPRAPPVANERPPFGRSGPKPPGGKRCCASAGGIPNSHEFGYGRRAKLLRVRLRSKV